MNFQILNNQQIEQIHLASAWLLSEHGLRFLSQRALQVFAEAGAVVDFDRQIVRIPGALLDKSLAAASGHFRLWDRDGKTMLNLQDGQMRGHNVGGCVRVYDYQVGQTRPASQKDLERMTLLIDALENIHVCRPVVYPAEFPKDRWDVFTAATMLQFTTKPYGVSAYSPQNLALILEITSGIAGGLAELLHRPFIWGSVCPESPLSYSENTAEILIRYAELGLPLAIAPCPVAGGTSPVTLAGTLVQLNAEFLAGFVLVQCLRPGIDVKYTARPLPMNLQNGNATFGAIEMGLMSAGLVQLARRYRVCSDVYGLGTRAHQLDERAGFEKALNGLLVGLAGADLVAAAGLLEDALTSSPEGLVIDDELLGMILRAGRGIAVEPATLALEAIQRTGPGGNFLSDEHTRKFLRQEHYLPHLVYQRLGPADPSPGAAHLLQAAQMRARSIWEAHTPPLLPETDRREIQRILERLEGKALDP
jgi:trimethylamine--corrinoid protein Co-methyltransferase